MGDVQERERVMLTHRVHAVATRYDKRDYRFQPSTSPRRIWLRDPSHDPRDTL